MSDAPGAVALQAVKWGDAPLKTARVSLVGFPGLALVQEEYDQDRCTRLCADANGWWYSVRLPCGRRVLAFHLDGHDPELSSLRHLPALLAKARRQPLLAEVLPVEAGFAQEPATEPLVHGRPAGSAALDLAALAAIEAEIVGA